MKLKEVVYLLGLRPKPKHYGIAIESHDLPGEGRVDVARWLHPRAPDPAPRQAEVDLLRRFLRPGDVAIDIGAQQGDTTIPMALAVGPSGTVLALEPNPYTFPVLARNAELNPGKTRIVPLMFAATGVDGTYEFQYGDEGYCNGGLHEGMSRWLHGSAFKVRVEGRNLPAWLTREHPDLEPRLRFIKVDAEGQDLAILETLEDLIRSRRPWLRVEMFALRKSPRGYRRRLFDFLLARGYDVRRYRPDAGVEGEPITPDNLTRWETYDVLCAPREGAA